MHLLLINPPLGRYDVGELAPPLGLLELAASARSLGYETSILDLNLPCHRSEADNISGFYDYCLALVGHFAPDEVGITSMGVNSHVAITLANRVASALRVPVFLGGPHLSSIADGARALSGDRVHVVTTRDQEDSAHTSHWWAVAPRHRRSLTADMSQLYAGISLQPYFDANRRRLANVELGFGCKYACKFCYSPSIYRSRFDSDAALAPLAFRQLSELGFLHAFLVQDNLLNSPAWARELCRNLSAEGAPLKWNAYATLADLSAELLSDLANAGCTNLYIGIDAPDRDQARQWHKPLAGGLRALPDLLAAAANARMTLTCAFIVDPAKLFGRSTLHTLQTAILCRQLGAEIRLALLANYPGTALNAALSNPPEYSEYSEDRASLLLDVPIVVAQNPYARKLPSLFPWHSRHLPHNEWRLAVTMVATAQAILSGPGPVQPENAAAFRAHCVDTALDLESVDVLHKLQLKETLRQLSRELLAGNKGGNQLKLTLTGGKKTATEPVGTEMVGPLTHDKEGHLATLSANDSSLSSRPSSTRPKKGHHASPSS